MLSISASSKCLNCGTSILGRRINAKHCSGKCREEFANKKHKKFKLKGHYIKVKNRKIKETSF